MNDFSVLRLQMLVINSTNNSVCIVVFMNSAYLEELIKIVFYIFSILDVIVTLLNMIGF
jgi:hypothetical protein